MKLVFIPLMAVMRCKVGFMYLPAKPKGIVQVIHGFGEHSRRYFHMIVKFMDAGYIVAADDHVGHGKTAMYNDTWGDWGDAGFHTMMEDEHKLKEIVSKMYPDLPYFMFGHSMGSFITRDLLQNMEKNLQESQSVVQLVISVVLQKLNLPYWLL